MEYQDHIYNIRGSTIMWVLHNNICDTFVVWVLAKNFNLKNNHNIYSGMIYKKYFLDYLIKNMKCTKTTAQHRLNKAINLKFIKENNKYYFITGRNKIAEIAFNKQKDAYISKLSSYKPDIFFLDDIRYSIKTKNLIDPTDINKTKVLLYGVMAVYGSRHLLSIETHAGILNSSRNAVIKLSNKSCINKIGTYLLINPMSLLFQPNCTRTDAVEAFRMAEKLFRFGSSNINNNKIKREQRRGREQQRRVREQRRRVRGREILQKRRVQEVTYLVVQLPNTFTNATIEAEIPVKFNSFMALLGSGEGASRILTLDRTQKPRQAECSLPVGSDVDLCRNSSTSRWVQREASRCHDTFISSRELAGSIFLPEDLINRYLVTIRDMLKDNECRDLIMRITGAQDIRHFTSDICRVWRSKVFVSRDTPVGDLESTSLSPH